MKQKLLFTLFFLLLGLPLLALAPVFITAGQSNADGRVYVNQLPYYIKANDYRHLNFASVAGPEDGTFGPRNISSATRWAFQDVVNYFIDQRSTSDFYAVKCTYGGTAIALGQTAAKVPEWNASRAYLDTAKAYRGDWTKGNSLAKSLTEGMRDLVNVTLSKLNGGYDVKAIMWHQGESDRKAADAYYDNFMTLVTYLRDSISNITGDEADRHLPVILGTISHKSKQYSSVVEQAQRKAAANDPNIYLIDMSDAGLREDNLHFDSAWTEYLGKKMFNVLVQIGAVDGDTIEVKKPVTEVQPSDTTSDSTFGDITFAAERSWDFTKTWSDSTKNALAVGGETTGWYAKSGWGYRYVLSFSDPAELTTIDGYVIKETQGLYFTSKTGNRLCVNPDKNIGLYAGGCTIIVPQVKPGQYVSLVTQTAKASSARGLVPTAASKQNLDSIAGGYASKKQVTNVWWIQDTFTQPVDAEFEITGGGIFIYKIAVSNSDPLSPTPIGISTVAALHNDTRLYTLSGVAVEAPVGPGIYIRNNKKIVVKGNVLP